MRVGAAGQQPFCLEGLACRNQPPLPTPTHCLPTPCQRCAPATVCWRSWALRCCRPHAREGPFLVLSACCGASCTRVPAAAAGEHGVDGAGAVDLRDLGVSTWHCRNRHHPPCSRVALPCAVRSASALPLQAAELWQHRRTEQPTCSTRAAVGARLVAAAASAARSRGAACRVATPGFGESVSLAGPEGARSFPPCAPPCGLTICQAHSAALGRPPYAGIVYLHRKACASQTGQHCEPGLFSALGSTDQECVCMQQEAW